MRTVALRLALTLGVLTLPGVMFAAQTNSVQQAKSPTPKKAKPAIAAAQKPDKEPPLTGSLINRKVKRNGLLTDGPSEVLVIDSNTIRITGANDISQVLNRIGTRH